MTTCKRPTQGSYSSIEVKVKKEESMNPLSKAYRIEAWRYRVIAFPKLRSRSRGTCEPFLDTSHTLYST